MNRAISMGILILVCTVILGWIVVKNGANNNEVSEQNQQAYTSESIVVLSPVIDTVISIPVAINGRIERGWEQGCQWGLAGNQAGVAYILDSFGNPISDEFAVVTDYVPPGPGMSISSESAPTYPLSFTSTILHLNRDYVGPARLVISNNMSNGASTLNMVSVPVSIKR
jgi:hypothetical protein